ERFNTFAKASASLAEGMDLSLWASHYRAEWHGSGQIPARAVREGLISRLGAIDPNEGGQTQRTNLNLDWRWRPSERQLLSVHAYGTYYSLSLFNNFTFFLNDPDHGDEINQRDRRVLAGVDTQCAPKRAARGERHDHGRAPVSPRHPAHRPGQHGRAAPPRPRPGRRGDRAVVLALPEVRSGPACLAAPGDRRPRRHLHLPRELQGQFGRRRPQRRRDAGSTQREGERDPRPLVPDGALRQLRDRLSQ